MIGPLPRIYRVLCAVGAIVFFVGAGAWLVTMTPIPVVASVGASVGAAAGAIAAYLLVHDFGEQHVRRRVRGHRRP